MLRKWKNFKREINRINSSIFNSREGVAMVAVMAAALMTDALMYRNWVGMPGICFMDTFALYSADRDAAVIPFAMIAIMFFIKNDFNQNIIIKYKSVRRAWSFACVKLCVICAYMAAVTVIMAAVCGKLMAYTDYNWNETHSIFVWNTHSTLEEVSYPLLASVTFTSMFFSILIFAMLMFLIYWITGLYPAALLAVLIFDLWVRTEQNNIFHTHISSEYRIWLSDISWKNQIVLPAAIAAVIFAVGFIAVKNREFAVEKKYVRKVLGKKTYEKH